MKYAAAHKRFFAFFTDLFILFGFYLLTGFLLGISALSNKLIALPLLGLWFFGGLLLASWLYHAILESSKWKATIGKRFFGLQVVGLEGNQISFLRASLRHFSKALSRFIVFVGFLMIFFTKKKQALHDKIASTVVIEN